MKKNIVLFILAGIMAFQAHAMGPQPLPKTGMELRELFKQIVELVRANPAKTYRIEVVFDRSKTGSIYLELSTQVLPKSESELRELFKEITSLVYLSPEAPYKIEIIEDKKFEFFSRLPKDVQALIIGEVINAPTFEVGMKRLSELRSVNRAMRDLIDDQYKGKMIIEMLAQKHPFTGHFFTGIDKSSYYNNLVQVALQQNLPSSLAWIKYLADKNPEAKDVLGPWIFKLLYTWPDGLDPKTALAKINNLIAAGANVNYIEKLSDLNVTSLLTHAAYKGNIAAVRLLLDAGADKNYIARRIETRTIGSKSQSDSYRGTALDIAIRNKNKELIDFLKSRGAKTAAELGKK